VCLTVVMLAYAYSMYKLLSLPTVRQKLSSDPTIEVDVSKLNENVAPIPTLFFAYIEMPST
jgi:hypothetical protein